MAGEQVPTPENARIAQLNDEFRRAGPNGDWYVTQGVQTLSDWYGLVRAVQAFNDFHPDNDPYSVHHMGSIEWDNEKTNWKIDPFDQSLRHRCDPLSPECRRVLTIL
jgi:hypothetical protein